MPASVTLTLRMAPPGWCRDSTKALRKALRLCNLQSFELTEAVVQAMAYAYIVLGPNTHLPLARWTERLRPLVPSSLGLACEKDPALVLQLCCYAFTHTELLLAYVDSGGKRASRRG